MAPRFLRPCVQIYLKIHNLNCEYGNSLKFGHCTIPIPLYVQPGAYEPAKEHATCCLPGAITIQIQNSLLSD